jgi:ABC-type polysaccharide/polyol phosphate transport system ATPase subunit
MRDELPPPVVVDRVHKRFEIPRERVSTLKERALHPLRRSPIDVLHALREISFAVEPGEFFGIVGRNGSGKSTLLKCLAGIYAVDSGSIYVNGRVSTFIELGVGFNPDLPARDNVILNATMLGLSPREARKRFDGVLDFAELGEFVDLKLKNYSSGMMVRLAFSVMIQVDAEILLIDEVLAVGDAAFQQKCYDEFERIRASGSTVLFVTHDMSAVQRFCDRALLLERGHVVELGDPEQVGNRYLELNFSEQAREAERVAAEGAGAEGVGRDEAALVAGAPPDDDTGASGEASDEEAASAQGARYGDGAAEIVDAGFEDERGGRAEVLQTGRPCTFAARVRFNEEIENPLFGINIQNGRRDHLLSASNLWSEPRCGSFAKGDEVTFRISFENVLAPDRYYVTPAVARQGGGWIDRRERMVTIVVSGTRPSDALLELPYELTIERGTQARGVMEAVR